MRHGTRLATLGLGLSVVFAACGGAGPDASPTSEVTSTLGPVGPELFIDPSDLAPDVRLRAADARYRIQANGKEYEGVTVSTNWIPTTKFIYLGPDESIEPLVSLKLTVGEGVGVWDQEDEDVQNYLPVSHAYMTTSDVKVGTGEELNGRSYSGQGFIVDYEIGPNWVKGELRLDLERVLFWPEDEPESMRVTGGILAVSK